MTGSTSTYARETAALADIFGQAAGFITQNDLGETPRYLIEFVLEELFTNMVKYNCAGGGRITVELSLLDRELMILLSDPDCPPFDIRTDAPEVDLFQPLESRTPGGLGIHLVKKMVDRIEYDHQDRIGTIRLFKMLE